MKNTWQQITVAVIFCTSVALATTCAVQAQKGKRPPALVVAAPVIQREVATGRTFVGTVHPLKKSVVGSAVAGRVEKFPINAGQWVKENDTLALLRTKTINIELAAANAELLLRQEELKEMENGSRPEEIERAKAEVTRAKALMDYAVARRKRTETLFQKNATASQEEFEQAVSVAEAARQNHLASDAAYKLVVEGPRKEKISQAKARVAVQQEEVNRIEDRIKKYTIRAPFDGYVTVEHTEQGEWLSSADPVAEVIQLDPVEIDVAVPEQYVAYLQSGMKATVTLSALSDRLFEGVVARVVPQADLRSRTFPVKVRVVNPKQGDGHLLKSGMLARVTLTVGRRMPTLLVPKDALVLGGPSPSVIVAVTDPKTKQTTARAVPVQIGAAYGRLIQVTGQLEQGDLVVVQGNERLRSGQPLKIDRTVTIDLDKTTSQK